MNQSKYKIKDLVLFRTKVFGADSFLQHWPELQTTGVPLKKYGSEYYIVDEAGSIVNDSAFFICDEVAACLVKC